MKQNKAYDENYPEELIELCQLQGIKDIFFKYYVYYQFRKEAISAQIEQTSQQIDKLDRKQDLTEQEQKKIG